MRLAATRLYSALMESSTAQATVGKMALRIKVTDLAGERLTFGRATGSALRQVRLRPHPRDRVHDGWMDGQKAGSPRYDGRHVGGKEVTRASSAWRTGIDRGVSGAAAQRDSSFALTFVLRRDGGMEDATDSKSVGRKPVGVRLPLPVPANPISATASARSLATWVSCGGVACFLPAGSKLVAVVGCIAGL